MIFIIWVLFTSKVIKNCRNQKNNIETIYTFIMVLGIENAI